jgi:hypothetical protein
MLHLQPYLHLSRTRATVAPCTRLRDA